jgi:hypothetical protein
MAASFLGLYLYDRAGDTARKEKVLRAQMQLKEEPLLPLNSANHEVGGGHYAQSPVKEG